MNRNEFINELKKKLRKLPYVESFWTLEDGVLNITHDTGTRFQILNFDFISRDRNYVIVHLPANAELEAVNVKSSSGNIKLGDFAVRNFEIACSFGNVDLSNITGEHIQVEQRSGRFNGINIGTKSLTFKNSFGDGNFQEIFAVSLDVESNSGNLNFTNCMFGDAIIVNNFGRITATEFVSTYTNIRANSGDININGFIAGETTIHAEFGSIKLATSLSKNYYSYDISVKFGNISFDGERLKDQSRIASNSMLVNHLMLTSSSGNIEVTFGE